MIDTDVVLDAARQQLVLDLDRGEARRFSEGNRAVHVYRVPPAAARVQDNRQLTHGAHIERHRGEFRQGQIGLGDALSASRASRR